MFEKSTLKKIKKILYFVTALLCLSALVCILLKMPLLTIIFLSFAFFAISVTTLLHIDQIAEQAFEKMDKD